jgi:hypothetical protein
VAVYGKRVHVDFVLALSIRTHDIAKQATHSRVNNAKVLGQHAFACCVVAGLTLGNDSVAIVA